MQLQYRRQGVHHTSHPRRGATSTTLSLIGGVLDGLMVAAGHTHIPPRWSPPELKDIHPRKWSAIEDDRWVNFIRAEKVVEDTEQAWYEVILEGEL